MFFFRSDPFVFPEIAAARRRRWKWFFVLLVLLLVAGCALRPGYRWAKAWRGRSLAAGAERAMAAGLWPEAAEKIDAAFQMAPQEPSVVRTAARYYSRVGGREAYDCWKTLLAMPAVSNEERREAVRFGFAVQRYDLCEEQIAILLRAEPAHADNLDLAGELAWQKQDRAAALAFNDQLRGLDPAHPGGRLLHGRLLASSSDETEKAQGRQELLTLGQSAAPTALSALETLANDSTLPPEQIRAVAAALATHPGARIEHRLAAVSLEVRLAPQQRTELIERAIHELGTGSPDAQAALARWLMQMLEPARVLELITLPASLTRRDLFLVRIDALAAQKEWSEIQRIFIHEKLPLQRFHQEVFLARTTMELGDSRAAKLHWDSALAEAAHDPSLLLYLAEYTVKIGALPVAEKAWRQLAAHPAWALRANAALVPLVEAQGNTRGLRDVMRELRRVAPNDPAPRHDEAYLDLLLGENIAAAQETAAQLLREHPERLAYHSTVALGQLRAGDPAAALRQYDHLDFAWEKAPPGVQAVRAAVLFANQEPAAARAAAASITRSDLKPEEQALIAPFRR